MGGFWKNGFRANGYGKLLVFLKGKHCWGGT